MRRHVINWSGTDSKVPGRGAARPDGRFVCLLPSRFLMTDSDVVRLPEGQDVLFPVLPRIGGRIACSGHADNLAWEWDGNTWTADGIAFGTNAVLYGAGDQLVVNHTKEQFQATGGLRYLRADGVIVSCNDSYADVARGLYGFTEWPDIAIGQGGKNIGQGAVVRGADGILRRLADGVIRDVVVMRDGDAFAITLVDYDARETTFLWSSLAELLDQPPVLVSPNPPAPPPIPVPVPPPTPEPKPMSLPDPTAVLHALEGERAKHQPDADGKYTNEQMGAMLNGAAVQFPDVGMHFRTGEKAATAPGVSRTFSRDVLRYLPAGDDFGWWSDVLGATGAGLAIPLAPEWQRSTDDRASFVPPARVVVQPPPPPPDPLPSGDLETRVRALEVFKAEWLADLAGLIASHR